MPKFRNRNIEFESCGYFRQKNWFKNTRCIILIGDKHKKPSLRETYGKALEWAAALFRGSDIVNEKECSMTALQTFAEMLLNDKDLNMYYTHAINIENTYFNALAHAFYNNIISILKVVACAFYEARGYAILFLRQMTESIHELKNDLNVAINRYESVIAICEQVYESLFKEKTNDEIVRMFMNPENRNYISKNIMLIRDKEAEAIRIFKKILRKFLEKP